MYVSCQGVQVHVLTSNSLSYHCLRHVTESKEEMEQRNGAAWDFSTKAKATVRLKRKCDGEADHLNVTLP